MLSYRHAFHAGNFADVHKHVVLVALLDALQRKARGITFVDTHAGAGAYDLAGTADDPVPEWLDGIGRVEAAAHTAATTRPLPPAVSRYLACAGAGGRPGEDAPRARRYPGSPAIARAMLRPQDRAILLELHPSEAPRLKRTFRGDVQVAVHAPRDAREAVPALLPPATPRGLVLIDPSYERHEEYAETAQLVRSVRRRWATAVIAVWYPLLGGARAGRARALHEALAVQSLPETFTSEVSVRDEGRAGLCGSGVFIVDPPWHFRCAWPAEEDWLRRALPRA